MFIKFLVLLIGVLDCQQLGAAVQPSHSGLPDISHSRAIKDQRCSLDDLSPKLAKALKTHGTGILYLWSPYMPLSQQGAIELMAVSKRQCWSMPIIFGKDYNAQNTLSDLDLEEVSLQLGPYDLWDMQNHFPAVRIFKNGCLQHNVIFGYSGVKGIEKLVRRGGINIDRICQ